MKCPKQSPFKPCRRSYGARKCGGKFIEVIKEADGTVYTCVRCERLIKSSLEKKPKLEPIEA